MKKMNKIIALVIGGILMVSVGACSNGAQTSSDAPNSTTASPKAPDANSAQASKNDASGQIRQNQENSDIRAREQRNNNLNGGVAENRAAGDIASEVRSKLEANIQGGELLVVADKAGKVTITGTVPNASDKAKIDNLAKQIKGVKMADSSKVTVAPATNKDNTKQAPQGNSKNP
jgi:osmotically-inducible protein OsmY